MPCLEYAILIEARKKELAKHIGTHLYMSPLTKANPMPGLVPVAVGVVYSYRKERKSWGGKQERAVWDGVL